VPSSKYFKHFEVSQNCTKNFDWRQCCDVSTLSVHPWNSLNKKKPATKYMFIYMLAFWNHVEHFIEHGICMVFNCKFTNSWCLFI